MASVIRLLYSGINHFVTRLWPRVEGESAELFLREAIRAGRPLMVARFGSVEIKALIYSILPPP